MTLAAEVRYNLTCPSSLDSLANAKECRIAPNATIPTIRAGARHWLPALHSRRELLWVLAVRDVKTRYKQSVLGLYWAIIEPLATAIVLTIVFSLIIRVDTGDTPYVIFLLTGLLPWTFFANAINSAAASIVRNPSLITKVFFPREILPLGAVLARMVDLAVSLVVLQAILFVYGIYPTVALLYLPIVIVLHMGIVLGISLLVAAANVFFRDVAQLLGIVLMLWMYVTPVFYPVEIVPPEYKLIFQLNPMVGVVGAYRTALLGYDWPDVGQMSYAVAVSILGLLLGYVIFKKCEHLFADVV